MQSRSSRTQRFFDQIKIILVLLAAMWALEIVDWVLQNALDVRMLDTLGIRPRTTLGLRGILFAPFLHFGFGHLMANTIPFAVLGTLVMLRGTRNFAIVTFLTVLVGGVGTWLIGSTGNHQGASILIFGYFGYLLIAGIVERSPQSIGLMLIVILLYGSLIWGVFPIWQSGISWEGHLSGFIAGGIAARWLIPPPELDEEDISDQIEILQ